MLFKTKNRAVNKTQQEMGETPTFRDDRIDSVKYWLMILVIAGHVFSQDYFSESQACTVVWKWIYMFHMPLFVFISGRFSYRKDKNGFLKSIWKLLEPLILVQFVMCLLDFASTGFVSFGKILTPWWVLWYLLSLTFWRLIIQLLPSKILNSLICYIFYKPHCRFFAI